MSIFGSVLTQKYFTNDQCLCYKTTHRDYILHVSNYMIFWKKQNYGDIQRQAVPMSKGRGRDQQAEHTEFLGE